MSVTPSCPASTLAKLFNLTERRIQQLAKNGIILKAKHGQYELVGTVQGYIKYLQDRALGRVDGSYQDSSDIKLERKRLIKAQADKTESENKKLRQELVAFSLVQDVLNEVAVLYGSSMDALPGRLANELAGISDPAEIRAKLFDECRNVRVLTATHLRGFAETLRSSEDVSFDSGCAQDKDAGPMGRQ